MSAKALLTFLFLVSLSAVVMLCFRALPQRATEETAAARPDVLVAAAALAPGTLLRAKDVIWRPAAGIGEPDQILRSRGTGSDPHAELDQQARSEVYGAALRIGVKAGGPITRGSLAKPGDRDFLQIVLAPRARAIAIPIATSGASAGLLFPGDYVDVILTQTFKHDPPLVRRSVSETVVENLRVLVIDGPETKPASAGHSFGRTVTLEVTPEQAERINVAAELGKLSLTLRSITAAEAPTDGALGGFAKTTEIKPIWAGDVSPALGEALTPSKIVIAEQPVVQVFHGTRSTAVKSQ
jgi:pilus assembly protein CpaB